MTDATTNEAVLGTVEAIDLDPLVALFDAADPIEGESDGAADAGGESLLYDPLYDEIKALRRQDDATLPQGVWKRDLKRADWREVAAKCIGGLTERSKDLQLTVWLIEAWGHRYGFPGLSHGLMLLTRLAAERWDVLYPRDEDDTPLRMAVLGWLEGRLPSWLKSVPVTRPQGGEGHIYGWSDWESGLYLSNLAQSDREAAEKAEAEGMTSQEKFLVSSSLTPSVLYLELAGQLAQVETRLSETVTVLAGCTDGEAPRFVQAGEILAAMRRHVDKLLKERAADDESVALRLEGASMDESVQSSGTAETSGTGDDSVEGTRPASESGVPSSASSSASGAIQSRADAFRRLTEAADYLLRTEPHSLAPYLVKRAVTLGNKSLAEVYQEVFVDGGGQISVLDLLGIAKTDAG